MLAIFTFSQQVPRKIRQSLVPHRLQLTQRNRSGQALSFVVKASARLAVEIMDWKAITDGVYEKWDGMITSKSQCCMLGITSVGRVRRSRGLLVRLVFKDVGHFRVDGERNDI
jgi:hypothetical protein